MLTFIYLFHQHVKVLNNWTITGRLDMDELRM